MNYFFFHLGLLVDFGHKYVEFGSGVGWVQIEYWFYTTGPVQDSNVDCNTGLAEKCWDKK